MRWMVGLLAIACGISMAVLGCDRATDPAGTGGGAGGGGDGGRGGEGGGVEAAPHCDSLCASLSACAPEQAPIDPAECAEDCRTRRLPAGLVEPCAACLESVECRVADVACRWAPACRMAWDVDFRAEGLVALEGRTLRVMVVEAIEGEHWVDAVRDLKVRDGAAHTLLEGVLSVGWDIPFDVVVIADGDGDGACGADGGDRAWRIPLGVPAGDATVTIDAASEVTNVDCGFWKGAPERLALVGAGLQEMEGKYVV
ncbi:MAG TPA: hypothetical protein VGD74_00925, partial [Vulgatibacter sp.]